MKLIPRLLPVFIMPFSFVLAFSSPIAAGASDYSKYITNRNHIAVTEYFAQMRTFATFRNRGQKPGDFYELPQFDLMPRRDKCFPGLDTSQLKPQNYEQPKLTYEINLSGMLGADIRDNIKAEVNGKVRLTQHVEGNIMNVSAEIASVDMFNSHLDATDCTPGHSILQKGTGDGEHLLIKEVYYAGGIIKSTYELKITGSLEAEVVNSLSKLLGKIGFSDLDLKIRGEVKGGIEETTERRYILDNAVPAAFVPLHLDADDLKQMYSKYITNGLDQALKLSLRDETKLTTLFKEYPELRKDAEVALTTMVGKGKVDFYDAKNEQHQRYLKFKENLFIANKIVKLSERIAASK